MLATQNAKKQKFVILGNDSAVGCILDEFFARAPRLHDVTVFGTEPRVNPDRIDRIVNRDDGEVFAPKKAGLVAIRSSSNQAASLST